MLLSKTSDCNPSCGCRERVVRVCPLKKEAILTGDLKEQCTFLRCDRGVLWEAKKKKNYN